MLPGAPEEAIDSLRRRLAAQALCRSALFFAPPLLAVWYIVFFLYRFAWLGPDGVMATGAAVLIAAAGLTAARFSSRAPSLLAAARLADEKSCGQDRFVTLATIGGAGTPELVSRLRLEAAALARRIDFKRDFPFRGDRSILNSLMAALAIVVIFQLAFEWLPARTSAAPGAALAAAANRLGEDPRFSELAKQLSAAAQRLRQPSLSDEDQRAILNDALDKLQQRIAIENSLGQDAVGLQDAAEAIKKALRENRGALRIPWLTQGDNEGSGKGTGGQGGGSGSAQKLENRGGYGERKEEKSSGKALDLSQQTTGEPQFAVQGEKRREPPDDLTKEGSQAKPGGAKEGRKTAAEKKRDAEGGEVKYQSGEKAEAKAERTELGGDEPRPRPAVPGQKAAGEIKEKDLRYVIVQLPEEATGGASGSGEAQARKSRQAAPVSNAPLAPPREPQAAGEKQMLPLEYRGMIR